MKFFDDLTARAMGLRAPALKSNRAPSGALGGARGYTMPDSPLPDNFDQDQVIARAYERNVYVYRCVNAIASSIVSQPFRAGDPISFNHSLTTPLARLLGPAPGGPNPAWSSAQLLKYSIVSYMLLGKFAWLIERDSAKRIVGLWPLRAQDLKAIPATSGTKYFKRFEYNNKGDENYREYTPDEVVYIWNPSIADFRKPETPVTVASLNINVSQILDKFDYNFWKNGGVPANLIVTPPFATKDEKTAFQQQFTAEFGGAGNAGRSMFVEREIEEGEGNAVDTVDVKILGTNQRDAEINALRKAENMAICLAFGVPMSILGDSTAVTFSNAFQDRRNYWLETLLPRAREIQDKINTELAPLLDPKVVGWFDVSGVPELRAEPSIPESVAIEWIRAGLVKVDEVRADRGLPSAERVGLTGELAEEEAPTLNEPSSDSLEKEAGEVVPPSKAPVASAPAASRSILITGSTLNPAVAEATVRHKGPDHHPVPTGHPTIKVLENILNAQVKNLLEDQFESTRQKVTAKRSKGGSVFDEVYWHARTDSILTETLRAMDVANSNAVVSKITHDTARAISEKIRSYPESGTQDGLIQEMEELFDNRRTKIVADIVSRAASVPASEVEKALMALNSGSIDIDHALAALEVSQ